MSTPERRLNLNVGINGTGYLAAGWAHRTGLWQDVADPEHYLRAARLAQRGVFDAVFVSDMPLLRATPDRRPGQTLDPLILATLLTAKVPDIGFIATVSSSYNSPFNLARRTQSVDIVSGGRLGINVVANFVPEVAANFGSAPLPPREVRYPRAMEFMDVVKKLWASWDPRRAQPVPEGEFWDWTQARPIDHQGDFFHVRGPLNVPRGPQGHPVVAQAGASDGGIDLAARHGELLYANVLSRPAGQAYRAKVAARARAFGRDPAGIRVVPGVVPILGATREEALRKHELYSGVGSEDGLLKRFAQAHGLDLQRFDPDAPLRAEDFEPDPNRIQALGFTLGLVELLRHETLSARQVVRRAEGNHRLLLGTPEQVADELIDLWADGTVDGYTIQPARNPDDIEDFVNRVVPILQARGVHPRTYEADTLRDRYRLPHPE